MTGADEGDEAGEGDDNGCGLNDGLVVVAHVDNYLSPLPDAWGDRKGLCGSQAHLRLPFLAFSNVSCEVSGFGPGFYMGGTQRVGGQKT